MDLGRLTPFQLSSFFPGVILRSLLGEVTFFSGIHTCFPLNFNLQYPSFLSTMEIANGLYGHVQWLVNNGTLPRYVGTWYILLGNVKAVKICMLGFDDLFPLTIELFSYSEELKPRGFSDAKVFSAENSSRLHSSCFTSAIVFLLTLSPDTSLSFLATPCALHHSVSSGTTFSDRSWLFLRLSSSVRAEPLWTAVVTSWMLWTGRPLMPMMTSCLITPALLGKLT